MVEKFQIPVRKDEFPNRVMELSCRIFIILTKTSSEKTDFPFEKFENP